MTAQCSQKLVSQKLVSQKLAHSELIPFRMGEGVSRSLQRNMSARRRTKRRSGVASFELVMSAPILMFLIAMMFTIYVATVKKSHLTMAVRHTSWLVRSNPEKADQRQEPFAVLNVNKSGSEIEERTTRVRTYQFWYPGVPRQVQWGNVVLTGSWDYRDVEFKEGGLFPVYPHIDVLGKMAGARGGIEAAGASIGQVRKLTGFPGLP